MRLKALLEKKKELAGAICKLRDTIAGESRNFTGEEQAVWDRLNGEYNANEAALAVEKRAADIERSAADDTAAEARNRRPSTYIHAAGDDGADAVSDKDRALALQAWFLHKMGDDITDAHREAAQRCRFRIGAKELGLELYRTEQYREFQRAYRAVHPSLAFDKMSGYRIGAANMTVGSAGAGGNLVPPGTLLNRLELSMLHFGGVRQVAETLRTATGEPLLWPTATDTSNTGELLAEETTFGTSVAPTIGRTTYNAYKFSSKPVLVSYELIRDSIFDLGTLLGGMLGERLGRITNTYFTTGTGTNQPGGIVTGSSQGKESALNTAFTGNEIIDLVHSVDVAYRMGAGFMMHDYFVSVLRKLVGSDGQYLWQPGMQAGIPDQLYGYPVTINNDMRATFGASQKIILFGQLSKFKIRTAGGVRVYHLQERYRDTDQDAFVSFISEDAKVLDAGTDPIKHLATPA